MARNICQNYCEITETPELFEDKLLNITKALQGVSKKIYDHTVKKNPAQDSKAKSLRTLLINGFDQEQIWQQVVLRNKCFLQYLNNLPKQESNVQTLNCDDGMTSEDQIIEGTSADPNSSGSSNVDPEDDGDYNDLSFDDDDDGSMIDPDEISFPLSNEIRTENVKKTSKTSLPKKSKHKSPVDDQFFKLSGMEQFLRVEDLKEERRRDGDDVDKDDDDEDEEDDEEEEIDLFQDIPSDEEEESEDEEEVGEKKSSKSVMYEDFFDAPESGDENVTDAEEEEQDNIGQSNVKDLGSNASGKEKLEESEDALPLSTKTAFELEHEKVQSKIAEYEESMLQPPEWQLTGEIAANSRPINSLVHMQTDFDSNARPVIIEDNELFLKMESMAKMAIKNKAYNDGERRYKSTSEEVAYKKEVILEQTKSKKGLAEVYEEDFLKKQKKQEEEVDPKHVEIQKLMDSLFPELHALFCHIPKPAIPDIKVVNNLPAITVEEVAPTSVSDVALLAPEEVKKKSGLVKGQTERTDTDRKRERRKKKVFQKMQQKKSEKQSDSDKPLSARARKQEKINTLKKLKQFRNTTIAPMDGERIKSSKDFFSKLQDASNVKKRHSVPAKKKK